MYRAPPSRQALLFYWLSWFDPTSAVVVSVHVAASRVATSGLGVATKMLSSPATVPTTSSFGARSIARATAAAWPGAVITTTRLPAAVARAIDLAPNDDVVGTV